MILLVDRLVQAINDRRGFCEWLDNIDFQGMSLDEAFYEALIIAGMDLDDVQYAHHLDETQLDFYLNVREEICPENQ